MSRRVMRIKPLLIASAAAAIVALPALAHQAAQPQPAPLPANQYPNGSIGPTLGQPSTAASPAVTAGPDETAVEEVSALNLAPQPPPIEYPGWARRDVWTVGVLDP